MTKIQLIFPTFPNNWAKMIDKYVEIEAISKLEEQIKEQEKEHIILPKRELWFNALFLTPPENVRVCIIGQDPYINIHNEIPEAMGLAFSIPKQIKTIPPSLRNIFKELSSDLNQQKTNGDLTNWAKQGVLLLNSSLTVNYKSSNSHSKFGWSEITNAVLQSISETKKDIVFILWGNNAKEKQKFLDSSKHLILTSPHPSGFSAYKGFFGSKPFSKTNQYLMSNNKKPIQWGD